MITLEFDRGTLLVRSLDPTSSAPVLPGVVYDPRVGAGRVPARFYRDIFQALRAAHAPFQDRAAAYERLELSAAFGREPFPYQAESVEAWWQAGGRGVVVLPTGAGKTYVAELILRRVARSTLVVTPTIDLLQQWYTVLTANLDVEVGLIGGGTHEPRPITVTTYDSAYLHMERLGDRFGLVVFDECHHLPGPSYRMAADCCLAPYRLGLTATPERQDGGERYLGDLIGPIVYRRDIRELAGDFLADYETVTVRVRLSDDERNEYEEARETYIAFLREQRVDLSQPGGWTRFLAATSRSPEGRRALLAYRKQKTIAQASGAKLRILERLLDSHRLDRVIIFTSDNATVYRIARSFLVPAITHQTKVKERHEILEQFNAGALPFLVTSRVLNEGVDVPAANVAIVLSGTGSVREHVQRLGRILRRGDGKRAVLYELIAEDTAEERTSERRRQHDAYR